MIRAALLLVLLAACTDPVAPVLPDLPMLERRTVQVEARGPRVAIDPPCAFEGGCLP